MKRLLVCLLFALPCCALPDSPTPKVVAPVVEHRQFFDRWQKIETVAAVSFAAGDMAITCRNLGQHGGYEHELPVHSCSGAVLFTAGEQFAALGVSFLLHRMHHDRLARIPQLYLLSMNAKGMSYSIAHR